MVSNPLPQKLQARHSTPRLLRRLQCIDRSKQHPESRRSERSKDRLDRRRPAERGQEGEDTGVGGRIPESGERTLETACAGI